MTDLDLFFKRLSEMEKRGNNKRLIFKNINSSQPGISLTSSSFGLPLLHPHHHHYHHLNYHRHDYQLHQHHSHCLHHLQCGNWPSVCHSTSPSQPQCCPTSQKTSGLSFNLDLVSKIHHHLKKGSRRGGMGDLPYISSSTKMMQNRSCGINLR